MVKASEQGQPVKKKEKDQSFCSLFCCSVLFLLHLACFLCLHSSEQQKCTGKMFADSGILHPYFHHRFYPEIGQQIVYDANGRESPFRTSAAPQFDLGEVDLFMVPQPMSTILEEPLMEMDPLFGSILSVEENGVPSMADIESVHSDPLFNEDFYECKKELIAKSAIKETVFDETQIELPSELNVKLSMESEVNILTGRGEPDIPSEETKVFEGTMQKSVSSGCLTSMEWINCNPVKPDLLDIHGIDLRAALGLRRAYSEGDIQTLSSGKMSVVHHQVERMSSEEREQKLLRYRNKRSKRNFGRKIKYACRKALADSQPRVRGRFARTEEIEVSNAFK